MDAEELARDLADRLRELPGAGTAIAAEAAPGLEAAARETASAGTDASGNLWAPTKDGRRPLAHADGGISVVARGSVVTLILRGVYVFHQRGIGKGKGKPDAKAGTPARPILPDPRRDDLPPKMRDVIAQAAARVRARIVGGTR